MTGRDSRPATGDTNGEVTGDTNGVETGDRTADAGERDAGRETTGGGKRTTNDDGATTANNDGATTANNDGATTANNDGATTASDDGATTTNDDGRHTPHRRDRPSRRAVLGALATGTAASLAGCGSDLLGGSDLLRGAESARPTAGPGGGGHPHEPALALVPPEEATHRAVGGRWADPGTWTGAEVPGDAARVHVPEGATVTLDHRDAARLKTVRVDGTLAVDPTTDTRLGVETLVTTPDSSLELGTPDDPIHPDATAEVSFVDLGPIDESWDAARVSKGLVAMGRVRVHGAAKTPFAAPARSPRRGDASLALPSAPTNWRRGDRVVVAGLNPEANEDEEAVVRRVAGATVHLDRALEHDHVPPADDLDAYVANLNRNVRLASENEDVPRRGHVLFTGTDVAVRHAGCYDLGRTDKSRPFTDPQHGTPPEDVPPNPRARYALHFHRTGTATDRPPRVVEGCVVWDSPGWGYVNHHSYAVVADCVSYDVLGAGFVAEAGNETGAFRGNFALRSEGSGELPDSRQFRSGSDEPGHVDDFGHGGHGFWLQGPGVAVDDNVAAGHRHHGFVFWNRALVDRPLRPGEEVGGVVGEVPNFPVEHVTGQRRTIAALEERGVVQGGKLPSSYVRLRSFSGNTVLASGGGLDLSRHMFGAHHTWFDEWSVVEDFTAYAVGPLTAYWGDTIPPDAAGAEGGNNGISLRYSHNVVVRNARLLGGGGGGSGGSGEGGSEGDGGGGSGGDSGNDGDDGGDGNGDRGEDGDGTSSDDGAGGVGVNRNGALAHAVVEDSAIEGWDRGVRAAPRAIFHVRSTRLDNDVNVQVEAGATDPRWAPAQKVRLEELAFGDSSTADVRLETVTEDGDLYGLFAGEGGVKLDGRALYLDSQAPDYVPIPDRETLDATDDPDDLSHLADVDPAALVGQTNATLWDAYGLAVEGRPLPGDAARDPRVAGGWIEAPDGDPPSEVWLAAEAGDVTAPMAVRPAPNAAGGRYVSARGADYRDGPPAAGRARYEFAAAPGTYRLVGRVTVPVGSRGSLWARVDGGEWRAWGPVHGRRGWQWLTLADETDEPVSFDLSGTDHVVEVAPRERATRLDALLVTAGDTTPVGFGQPADNG